MVESSPFSYDYNFEEEQKAIRNYKRVRQRQSLEKFLREQKQKRREDEEFVKDFMYNRVREVLLTNLLYFHKISNIF